MQTMEISFNRYVITRRITPCSRRTIYGKSSFKWCVASAVYMKS